jgi:hypothetical protein
VRERLQILGVPTRFIDQRRVLETRVELAVGTKVEGRVNIGDEKINLDKVTAAYPRPYESVRLPVVASAGPGSSAWDHACLVEDILGSWCEVTPAFVVNRCASMAANGSKPYQLALIRDLGWSVPETLVTTDPDAARAFWDQHGEVIYKSVSAVRSRVSRLRSEHMDRLCSITSCPTQFQQYIDGVDHRVHVVGEEIFACEVLCTADDYRYSVEDIPDVRPCSLPQDIEDKCRDLAAAMDLPLAGIDLRRTPRDEWFCFEVNPSPAFTYYEAATEQPIGAAIAGLLANGSPPAASARQATLRSQAQWTISSNESTPFGRPFVTPPASGRKAVIAVRRSPAARHTASPSLDKPCRDSLAMDCGRVARNTAKREGSR